jgi:hypothetical protein
MQMKQGLRIKRRVGLWVAGLWVAALALCAAAGCAPPLSDGTWQAQSGLGDDTTSGTTTDTSTEADGTSSVDLTDLSGTWVRATDWSTCVKVIGRFDESRIYTLTRVQVSHNGYRLSEVHDICQVKSTPVAGLETLIPKAAVESGNPIFVESMLFGQGAEGAAYESGLQVQLWGIQMEDPLSGAMPTKDTLPDDRIFDADNDGEAGVTFAVGGDFCFMRAVQRTLSSFSGTLQADGRITGASSVVSEQFLIEATNGFCETSWEVRSNDAYNNALMVRVDDKGLNLDTDGDGAVSCDEIIAAQEQIITWTAVDKTRCKR